MSDISLKTDIPKILLIDEKGIHEGMLGAYCWNKICVNQGIPTNRTSFKR